MNDRSQLSGDTKVSKTDSRNQPEIALNQRPFLSRDFVGDTTKSFGSLQPNWLTALEFRKAAAVLLAEYQRRTSAGTRMLDAIELGDPYRQVPQP